jgi:hypothetical protein
VVNRLDRLIRHRAGELDICGTRAARLADPDLQRKRLDLARGVDTRRHGRGVCREPTALLLPAGTYASHHVGPCRWWRGATRPEGRRLLSHRCRRAAPRNAQYWSGNGGRGLLGAGCGRPGRGSRVTAQGMAGGNLDENNLYPVGSSIHISINPQGSVWGSWSTRTPAADSRSCSAWTSRTWIQTINDHPGLPGQRPETSWNPEPRKNTTPGAAADPNFR